MMELTTQMIDACRECDIAEKEIQNSDCGTCMSINVSFMTIESNRIGVLRRNGRNNPSSRAFPYIRKPDRGDMRPAILHSTAGESLRKTIAYQGDGLPKKLLAESALSLRNAARQYSFVTR
jgi:hypothetical protein